MSLRPGLDGVVEQEVAVLLYRFCAWLNLELVHSDNDGLGTLHEVFEHCRAIVVELIFRVSFEVDDLHLLHNRRLAALAGPWNILELDTRMRKGGPANHS